ncbi:MAG: metal-sulfur cluster assembly factor [Rhodocyclaceae bacterium]|nr:metal-sulfur cluster assembly factor [Rhodocyclaceae bacterium]
MPNEEKVRGALRSVIDPEAGMNIVDLGLVYAIALTDSGVQVSMTMTTPACPVGPMLVDEAKAAIRTAMPDAGEVTVELVWEPAWHAGLMSEHAKKHFGW